MFKEIEVTKVLLVTKEFLVIKEIRVTKELLVHLVTKEKKAQQVHPARKAHPD